MIDVDAIRLRFVSVRDALDERSRRNSFGADICGHVGTSAAVRVMHRLPGGGFYWFNCRSKGRKRDHEPSLCDVGF